MSVQEGGALGLLQLYEEDQVGLGLLGLGLDVARLVVYFLRVGARGAPRSPAQLPRRES